MDAIKELLPDKTKRVLCELLLMSTLLFAPVVSYALSQGIPAIKLLSLSTLMASAALSYLTVALFALGGFFLTAPLIQLHSKDPALSPLLTPSKPTRWLVIFSVDIVVAALLLSSIVSMVLAVGWAGTLFTSAVTGLFGFRGWNLGSNHARRTPELPVTDDQPFENLKFDLHGMPLKDVKFELSIAPPPVPTDKDNRNTENLSWILFFYITCGVAMSLPTQVLVPLGRLSLRFANMGGGLPVELKIENSPQPEKASLILETSDGWFLRVDGHCNELLWIKAEDLQSAQRLKKTNDEGQNIGECNQTVSSNNSADSLPKK